MVEEHAHVVGAERHVGKRSKEDKGDEVVGNVGVEPEDTDAGEENGGTIQGEWGVRQSWKLILASLS